jgi:hypothetical protein
MTIKAYIDLPADAKRAMTFADVRAILDAQLGNASLATIRAVVIDTYGSDDRVRLGRTKAGVLALLRNSMFDLKENCDRNR